MKKLFFLIIPLLILGSTRMQAKEPDFMSLACMTPASATQEQLTAMFGKPSKIEETKKTSLWYYNSGNNSLVLCWDKRADQFVKFSFISKAAEKPAFDARLSRKLRSGTTDLDQALALLGTPRDMTIKEYKQEVHYSYQNNALRLFFRNGVLVDYTLLGQGGR